MKNNDTENELKKIKNEIIGLKNSPLYNYRVHNQYHPVIGQGNHSAKIIFIGEAPGRNEAETGRPFCGAAGKILDELLGYIGIDRNDVYITNILKDRPPGNRDPLPEEIEIYAPFLDRQIKIIKPKIIATLGRYAMKYIMEKFKISSKLNKISNMHGKIYETNPLIGNRLFIVPLYHPAVAIYNRNKISELKKDFLVLKNLIGKEQL